MRFLGGIFGIAEVKTITQAQYKKLQSIEYAAKQYAWKLTGDWSSSIVLQRYHEKWEAYAEKIGILTPYGNVRYKVEGLGKQGDYSHGYNLGDAMA